MAFVRPTPEDLARVRSLVEQYPQDQHIARFFYIARQDKNPLAFAASVAAIDALRKSRNVNFLVEHLRYLAETFGPGLCDVPTSEITELEKSTATQLSALQTKRGNAESSLVKDQIRVAVSELAVYYFSMGDTQSSAKCLQRWRDNCTTPAQLAEWGFRAAYLAMFSHHSRAFALATQYQSKMENFASSFDDQEYCRYQIMNTILSYDKKNYALAVRSALNLRKRRDAVVDVPAVLAPIMTPADFLALVVLSCLTVSDRSEISQVASNSDLKSLFELEPRWKQALDAFVEADFATALNQLQALTPFARLDILLGNNVGSLLGNIRQRALQQYVAPFSSLDLRVMAAAFQQPPEQLEKDVAQLIGRGLIPARIDRAKLILHAKTADPKAVAFRKAMEAGDSFVHETTLALRVLSLQRAEIAVPPPPRMMMMAE